MGKTKDHVATASPPSRPAPRPPQGMPGVEGGSGGRAQLHPQPRPSARGQLHGQQALRAPTGASVHTVGGKQTAWETPARGTLAVGLPANCWSEDFHCHAWEPAQRPRRAH